ncbi:MAG: isochorismate synthase [Cyanobacteria bacterium J06638_7]
MATTGPELVQAGGGFSALLEQASRRAGQLEQDGVLSLAIPLAGGDPFTLLPHLDAGGEGSGGFRFLWDGAPGLCIAASGRTHSLELSGPRRFELARRFASATLNRLTGEGGDSDPCPRHARPRLLLAFSFFDSPLEGEASAAPGVQAVLPRWQLSRHGQHCWLRLQRALGGGSTARSLAEELWEAARALEAVAGDHAHAAASPGASGSLAAVIARSPWQERYRLAASQALALVDEGRLEKLVLAVRQQLRLDRAPDPLALLAPLRRHQSGSCRFLWQRSHNSALLGASPERLLTVRQGQLRSDALAGTAQAGQGLALLASAKDRLEHELVVDTIMAVLSREGLRPQRPRHPRLARHGHLVHLHTPIRAALGGRHPLAIAAALHPTPAVAGLPRREAMGWLRSLEPFERGHYAAPVGWIDSAGDADLRVAIRSGTLRGCELELTAGAGLVPGSAVERELQEVALKLGVLQQQLNLPVPGRW